MAEADTHPTSSMIVPADQPLIGVFVREGGRELVRYFADEDEADAALGDAKGRHAMRVAGAWGDLDWEDMATELERIRAESRPSEAIAP